MLMQRWRPFQALFVHTLVYARKAQDELLPSNITTIISYAYTVVVQSLQQWCGLRLAFFCRNCQPDKLSQFNCNLNYLTTYFTPCIYRSILTALRTYSCSESWSKDLKQLETIPKPLISQLIIIILYFYRCYCSLIQQRTKHKLTKSQREREKSKVYYPDVGNTDKHQHWPYECSKKESAIRIQGKKTSKH